MSVNIEKKYQKLSDTEHVLLRPGMYIGSIKPHTEELFIPTGKGSKFELKEITYNPGFLKLFDEIVSNSVDEHKRNQNLNKIDVTVDIKTGKISIYDNGGIPVQIHKEYDEWVPEMIFSNLKTGSMTASTAGSEMGTLGSTDLSLHFCEVNNVKTKALIIKTAVE